MRGSSVRSRRRQKRIAAPKSWRPDASCWRPFAADSRSGVKTDKPGTKPKNRNDLAESAGPQAHQPERSGSTFRPHCTKVPSIRSYGSVTAMIRVVAGIIEQNGRVLICQRQAGRIFAGKWEFPGGKMRPSETPRQALERELREELGVAARIGKVIQTVRHRYAEMNAAVQVVFLRAALEGSVRNLAFERIVWARREELPRYDFLAADRRVIFRLVREDTRE